MSSTEGVTERLMPLRVRGESWTSCVLRVPVTILLLLLCATLRSLLDVVACGSDARMCVSANGVPLEPLRPGTGVGELLRMVSVGNISEADALGSEPGTPLASSYLSQPWLRPGVVGEDAALPVHDACTPSSATDYDYKACADECKAASGSRHCHFCKCQACLFCRSDGAAGPAAAPAAPSAKERLLVVGARSGPEARHARAIGQNIALLGFDVHFLGAPYAGPLDEDEPTATAPASNSHRGRRRGGGLQEVSLPAAMSASEDRGYATIIVHLHLLSGTRHAGGAGPYAELVQTSGNAGAQVREDPSLPIRYCPVPSPSGMGSGAVCGAGADGQRGSAGEMLITSSGIALSDLSFTTLTYALVLPLPQNLTPIPHLIPRPFRSSASALAPSRSAFYTSSLLTLNLQAQPHVPDPYSPTPVHLLFSQVICVCARAQPPSLLDALWRRMWIPRYCHRVFILPNDGAPSRP
jgi:hypothetical protein